MLCMLLSTLFLHMCLKVLGSAGHLEFVSFCNKNCPTVLPPSPHILTDPQMICYVIRVPANLPEHFGLHS